MLSPPEERKAVLFTDSPPLNRAKALAKFAAWEKWQIVNSTVAHIGSLALTENEQILLSSARIRQRPYTLIHIDHPLYRDLNPLLDAFCSITTADLVRSGIQPHFDTCRIYAGYYDHHNPNYEPWHTDLYGEPSIRYVVSFGVGSTRFAKGPISLADIHRHGHEIGSLYSHIAIGPNGKLYEDIPPIGTISRFMNVADIHAGTPGEGTRVMLQATRAL